MTRATKRSILAFSLIAAAATMAGADEVNPPAVPGNLEVPAGHQPYLMAHAVGTQNQVCQPGASSTGLVWTFFGPQATVFDAEGEQLLTHYLSANPLENGAGRATWQHSRDSSEVWGLATASSLDPDFVAPGAVAWLRLQVVGAEDGPTGGDRLSATTFIQRVNTVGGIPASTTCYVPGAKLFVPYEADYVFYRAE